MNVLVMLAIENDASIVSGRPDAASTPPATKTGSESPTCTATTAPRTSDSTSQ